MQWPSTLHFGNASFKFPTSTPLACFLLYYPVFQSLCFWSSSSLLWCYTAKPNIYVKLWAGRQGGTAWGAPLWEWAPSRGLILAGFLVSYILMVWDIPLESQPGICFSWKELDLFANENVESFQRKSFVFIQIGLASRWIWEKKSLFKYKQWINGLPWGQR